ncbi:hypothetical protein SeLEV6574_g00255 [Synchytrium endobioticum]|uniref:Uncharacterized protein n=1 Tax=Synchytrium endobioticum TaxID=286115 RepID=A0A507DKU3_9FUNG|nr:hypothetical protein SeLEV6574_g00255 [Synchytrium endobioticum]
MPVLVVGDGEFGWRAPHRASPAKSCFRTAAAAGALVVFSPERFASLASPRMHLGAITESSVKTSGRMKGGFVSARHTRHSSSEHYLEIAE